jgi:hypothetical protein
MEPATLCCAINTQILDVQKGHVAVEARVLHGAAAPRTHDLHNPSIMQRLKAVTSHAFAYVRHWWCKPGFRGERIYEPGGDCSEHPARVSARMLIAAGCGNACR